MKIVTRLAVLFALIGCISIPALGWDEAGHKITAYIAWQRMTPEVREKVVKILQAAPEDSDIAAYYSGRGLRSMESQRREFFMLMAYWPDIVRDRNLEIRNKKYHQGDWHYVNLFWKWEGGKSVFIDEMEPNGNALKKITEFDALIRSGAADSEKAIAIAWLEHLIGDIHQPLHASGKVTDSNPKGDQGGNLFLLTPKGTPRDKQENLHWFWDSIIGRYSPNIKDQSDAEYLDPIAQEIIKLYPYDKLKDSLNSGKFELWARESVEIAMSELYKDLKFFESPSDKYKKKAFEIAQKRLALAGYRMGDIFNEAFSTKPAVSESTIPCKMIRKVMYPVTKTSSVKQTLEIALLDLCPTRVASRPMYSFMIDGKMVMKEYDVVRTFKTEAEARKYAAENNITDISF